MVNRFHQKTPKKSKNPFLVIHSKDIFAIFSSPLIRSSLFISAPLSFSGPLLRTIDLSKKERKWAKRELPSGTGIAFFSFLSPVKKGGLGYKAWIVSPSLAKWPKRKSPLTILRGGKLCWHKSRERERTFLILPALSLFVPPRKKVLGRTLFCSPASKLPANFRIRKGRKGLKTFQWKKLKGE